MTKAELDIFKMGTGVPNCVLEARPLCEQFPQLLIDITLSGIKPPYDQLTLSYMPTRKGEDYRSYAQVKAIKIGTLLFFYALERGVVCIHVEQPYLKQPTNIP